jgi:hypothetical protein
MPTLLGPLEGDDLGLELSKDPPITEDGTDAVSVTLCLLVFKIPDDGQSPSDCVAHNRQNSLDSRIKFVWKPFISV